MTCHIGSAEIVMTCHIGSAEIDMTCHIGSTEIVMTCHMVCINSAHTIIESCFISFSDTEIDILM